MQKPRLSIFPCPDSTDHGAEESTQAEKSGKLDRHSGKTDSPRSLSPERIQHEIDRVSGTLEPRSVTVRLATIVPLLLDAVEHNRTWLSDFADDTVRLDADLFEVLLAYQELRGEAAA